MAMKTYWIIGVPQVGSSDAIYRPVYLQPKIFQLSSVSRIFQQYEVTFTGSPEIDPFVNITITHTVSNYLVTIHVDGRARQPQITFSSTPELDQSDILSLLIVGKTMEQLTSSEQASLSSQLGGAAGSLVTGKLQEALGGALGLDTLTISPGESSGAAGVSVG